MKSFFVYIKRIKRKFSYSNVKTYLTFQDAIEDSPNSYDSNEIAKVVSSKTLIFENNLLGSAKEINVSELKTIFGVSLLSEASTNRVLDFGGAAGYHFFISKYFFSGIRKFDWRVVETSEMVHEGRCSNDNSELKFFDSLPEALGNDFKPQLVLASSVLQYMPDPLAQLRKLTELSAEYIYISRTPMSTDGKKQIFIQSSLLSENGPGSMPLGHADKTIHYPATLLPFQEFEAELSKLYTVILKIDETENSVFENIFPSKTFGYLCKIKAK
jgi:putative methyltransferase (TIGR04325 family)